MKNQQKVPLRKKVKEGLCSKSLLQELATHLDQQEVNYRAYFLVYLLAWEANSSTKKMMMKRSKWNYLRRSIPSKMILTV